MQFVRLTESEEADFDIPGRGFFVPEIADKIENVRIERS